MEQNEKMCYDVTMKKRVAYYASRKNFFLWLSVCCMLFSAIARIAYFCGKGTEKTTVWFSVVLPILAGVWLILILLFDAKQRLYRIAIPNFLLAAYFAIRIFGVCANGWLVALTVAAALVYCGLFRNGISGKLGGVWICIALLALSVCAVAFFEREALLSGSLFAVSDLTATASLLIALFAVKAYDDGKYHPIWGDRCDGRRLRSLDPVQIVANYIMPNRVPASNSIRETLDITQIEAYIRQKRKEGLTGFGLTHVILAAYVRCVAKYPAINRFLSGQMVYSRDEDIQFNMMVKEEMTTEGAETAMKLHLSPRDTAQDVYYKMAAEVARIKKGSDASGFDKTAKLLSYMPGVVFKFTIWLLKLCDYFGLIPKFLLEVSPFHGSVFFTSMGSLGIPPVVHHLYDFGNLPVFIAFGCKYRKNEIADDGTVEKKKYIDYTVNTDERICDGFYFATVLKYLKRLLAHPERLDEVPEEIVRDIE